MKSRLATVAALVVAVGFVFGGAGQAGTLLSDHFGVNLQLGAGQYDFYQGVTTYPFVLSSFAPTKNVATTNWVQRDWYGYWSKTSFAYKTVHGTWPSGGEPYDIEAMYFDDDKNNIYLAVVTSFNPVPGYHETRYSGAPLLIAGDLSLNLGLNQPAAADGWRYDYGVNINPEVRHAGGNASSGGTTPDGGVYRTANGDWYLGTPSYAVAGNELTNLDPNFSGLAPLGYAAINIYPLALSDANFATWVLEMTVPRALLGGLDVGQNVGLSYLMGCRNDGIRFWGDIDNAYVPEPTTIALLTAGVAGLWAGKRRHWLKRAA